MPEDPRPVPSATKGGDQPLSSHFRMAPVYAGQLAWTTAIAILLAGVCLFLGFTQALPSTRALGLHLVLLSGVLAALWRMVSLRAAVSLEVEARADQRRKEEERAKAGRESLFAEEPEGVPRHWTSEYRLEGYAYVRQRIVLLVAALGAGVVSFLLLLGPVPLLGERILGVAALEFAVGFACVLASRYFALVGAKGVREAPALAGWLRSAQWMALAAFASLVFARITEHNYPVVERWICRIILAWTVICAVELIARTLIGMFGERPAYDEVQTPIELISVQLVFATANPLKSLSEGLEQYLGISIQASWGLRFLGRAFLPLVFLLGVLLWGMTALEMVHPHEIGLLEHWGKFERELGPGLHLKWPWPIDRVRHYPARQVSEMHLGFELEDPTRRMEFILWTRVHAEEYQLPLNEAQDLLSLQAYVYYRVRDVAQYAYQLQNPDQALEALAYRELMLGILPYDLDDLLSRDRTVLPETLKQRIQSSADAAALGVEVLEVAFVGLHPPVEIADAYQEVVGAQIGAETQEREEEAFAAKTIPGAEATALEWVNAATGAAVRNTELAAGGATAFKALLGAYRKHPFLFKTAHGALAYERALAGRPFIVIDDAFDSHGHKIELIYQRGLPLPPFMLQRSASPP